MELIVVSGLAASNHFLGSLASVRIKMELIGIEPTASCLQSRRSPS